jgi:hypothetical protein
VSLRLRALELHTPGWVSRYALSRLAEATTTAFDSAPVEMRGWDHGELLSRYASFTAGWVERAAVDGTDLDAVSRRAWANARVLGESFRRLLGVRTRSDALRATRIAYRMIGIELRSDMSGAVSVDRCAFAARYSPQVCRVMSSFDDGLVAGLTQGGTLSFAERITEGRPRCLGRIAWERATP